MDINSATNLLALTLNALSHFIFIYSKNIFSLASVSLWNQTIIKLQLVSATFYVFFISMLFIGKYRGRWKLFIENRYTLSMLLVVGILSVFQSQIISFTLNVGNNFFSDNQMVNLVSNNFALAPSHLLSTAVISFTSAGVTLIVSLSQLVEVICLRLLLVTAPLALVFDTFTSNKHKLSSHYIREVLKISLNPIIQALFYYIGFNIILPMQQNSISKFTMMFFIILTTIPMTRSFNSLFEEAKPPSKTIENIWS